MEKMKYAFEVSDINFPVLQKRMLRRYYGWSPYPVIFGSLIVVFASSFFVFRNILLLSGIGTRPIVAAWFVSFLVLMIMNSYFKKSVLKKAMNVPCRKGIRNCEINSRGIQTDLGINFGLFPWDFITDIQEDSGILLLCYSPFEFIPVPLSSLPKEIPTSEAIQQIKAWRDNAVTK